MGVEIGLILVWESKLTWFSFGWSKMAWFCVRSVVFREHPVYIPVFPTRILVLEDNGCCSLLLGTSPTASNSSSRWSFLVMISVALICVGEGGRLNRVLQRCWLRAELGPGLPTDVYVFVRSGSLFCTLNKLYSYRGQPCESTMCSRSLGTTEILTTPQQ